MKKRFTSYDIALPHRIGDLEIMAQVLTVSLLLPHRIGDLEIACLVVRAHQFLPHRIGDLENHDTKR